jgi:hypothetical protein
MGSPSSSGTQDIPDKEGTHCGGLTYVEICWTPPNEILIFKSFIEINLVHIALDLVNISYIELPTRYGKY